METSCDNAGRKCQDFSQVLLEELAEIERRRGGTPVQGEMPAALHERYRQGRERARQRNLIGLAISGGGIRSATIGLGFLQALAELNLLGKFDYLSTVSGGGYIGGWLAAWIKREGRLSNVESQLKPSRKDHAAAERLLKKGLVVDDEPEPVYHLRAYSNYLAPKLGLQSTDSWTLVAIYIRNLFLNLVFLLPVLAAVMIGMRLVVWCYYQPGELEVVQPVGWIALGALAIAFFFMGLLAPQWFVRSRALIHGQPPQMARDWPVYVGVLTELLLAAALGSWLLGSPGIPFLGERRLELWRSGALGMPLKVGLSLAVADAVLGFLADIATGDWKGRDAWELCRRITRAAVSRLLAGAFLGVTLVKFGEFLFSANPLLTATLGPPVLLVLFVLATAIQVGVMGNNFDEGQREWWASITAYVLKYALFWAALFAVVFYGPKVILSPGFEGGLKYALQAALASAWLGTAIAGAIAGRSPTGNGAPPAWWRRCLGAVAPWIFLVGLLVVVALGLAVCFAGWPSTFKSPADWYATSIDGRSTPVLKIIERLLICAFLALVTGSLVNANLFSLHALYGNRLVRCYLGASRAKSRWLSRDWTKDLANADGWLPKNEQIADWGDGRGGAPTGAANPPGAAAVLPRCENFLTGFDWTDDLPLASLAREPKCPVDDCACALPPYTGPLLLVNTALNLVAGEELAWQERRADSFILSPLFCGSPSTGYRRTHLASRLTLGRAMAISGAAVSPNMGNRSETALTALMTFFNVRLGWWMENPNTNRAWTAKSPGRWGPLLNELRGNTNETAGSVYLSDGGHFENLGAYELVRRRCRFIVVCDNGADPKYQFEDLGNLIRKVRVDFGIRIDIDTMPIQHAPGQFSRWHCAMGTIHYEDVDIADVPGVLIYVKASLTGDEPADVCQHASQCPDFPHDPTVDQFFSESQFESYRALGHHLGSEVFKPALGIDEHEEALDVFTRVYSRWFPPPPYFEESFFEISQLFSDLHAQMQSDPLLEGLFNDLYSDVIEEQTPPRRSRANDRKRQRAELNMVAQILEAMEQAWLRMRLTEYSEHPVYRGWMNLFRRWTNSKILNCHWAALRGQYSKEFVRFCKDQLKLVVYDICASRMVGSPRVKVDPRLDPLIEEFYWDWYRETDFGPRWGLEDRVEHAEVDAKGRPLGWIIETQPAGDGKVFPVGLILVSKATCERVRGFGDWEFLVWMRGPYRNLGTARDALNTPWSLETGEPIDPPVRSLEKGRPRAEKSAAPREKPPTLFDFVKAELAQKPGGEKQPDGKKRLFVRFPAADAVAGNPQLEHSLWSSFFYRYGFRRNETTPPGKDDVLYLEV